MSEENENLGDEIKKGAEEALDSAKEAAKNIKEKAGEFAEDAKETADEFIDEAKETFNEIGGENKKVMAGILGILLGSLGIHKFVLGYTKEGVIQILLSFLCGLGGIIGLIEGIIYLTKSDEEFYQTYQVGKKPWF